MAEDRPGEQLDSNRMQSNKEMQESASRRMWDDIFSPRTPYTEVSPQSKSGIQPVPLDQADPHGRSKIEPVPLDKHDPEGGSRIEPIPLDELKIPVEALIPEAASTEQREEAKAKLDKLADGEERADGIKLSSSERAMYKLVAHAIIDGEPETIDGVLKLMSQDPEAFRQAMSALRHDLKDSGIHLSYGVGNMMIGTDDKMHPVGQLTIYMDGANRYLEFSTEPRLGVGVGGPIEWQPDGTALLMGVGYTDSPDAVLGQVGSHAARKLAPKSEAPGDPSTADRPDSPEHSSPHTGDSGSKISFWSKDFERVMKDLKEKLAPGNR